MESNINNNRWQGLNLRDVVRDWFFFTIAVAILVAGIWENMKPIKVCPWGITPVWDTPREELPEQLLALLEEKNRLQRELHRYDQEGSKWLEKFSMD